MASVLTGRLNVAVMSALADDGNGVSENESRTSLTRLAIANTPELSFGSSKLSVGMLRGVPTTAAVADAALVPSWEMVTLRPPMVTNANRVDAVALMPA